MVQQVPIIVDLFRTCMGSWDPFLETPDNFPGPKTYFRCTIFSNGYKIFIDLKAKFYSL